MNHNEAKALGATITDRCELKRFYAIARDENADGADRREAASVLMGAAQAIDPAINSRSAAFELLALDKPDALEGDALVLALSRAVDTVRENAHEPVWVPLEAVLPYDWCGGFMFMAAREVQIAHGSPDGRRSKMVFSYKHGITRHYLHIGDDLQAYVYRGDNAMSGTPVYTWTALEGAIERAFDGLDDLGAERTTKYDTAFIAERNARLVAAGYTVVG